MAGYHKELTDQTFGKWTVLAFSHIGEDHAAYWLCRCKCGREKLLRSFMLTGGRSTQCISCSGRQNGAKANLTTHDESRPPSKEYRTWHRMKQRCLNPNHKHYKHYGGRGITVCEQWLSYEGFLADMGRAPSPLHTIDRINNELGYSPENCCWKTRYQQVQNQRSNVMTTVNNITAPLTAQCRLLKLDYRRVRSLMSYRGWSAEYAIANYSPKADYKLTEHEVQLIRWIKGMTQPELAAIYGVIQQNISSIKLGKRWKHVPPFSIDEFMTRAISRLR